MGSCVLCNRTAQSFARVPLSSCVQSIEILNDDNSTVLPDPTSIRKTLFLSKAINDVSGETVEMLVTDKVLVVSEITIVSLKTPLSRRNECLDYELG